MTDKVNRIVETIKKIYGFIYKITFPNEKIYIGLTTLIPEKRWKQHKLNAKNINRTEYLYNAIRKYKFDNLKFEVIDKAYTREELCELEKKYILEYNSYYNNRKGYNMTYGGNGTSGYKHTEEEKERRRQLYIDNPEERIKASERSIKVWSDQELRKTQSEKTKKYHEEHPGEYSERMIKYHQEHPEAGIEHGKKMKQYYKDNPDALLLASEKTTKYFKNNPEAGATHSKKMKQYYIHNPEVIDEMSKKGKLYFEEHPEARSNMSEKTTKYFKDNPEAGPAHSKKMKELYENNPEKRQNMSKIKKQQIIDNPELRKQGKQPKPFIVYKENIIIGTFHYQFQAKDYIRENYNKEVMVHRVLNGTAPHSHKFIFKYI